MPTVKIELNHAGIDALLKSAEVKECIVGHASEIRQRVGDGYAVDDFMTPSRIVSSVYTETAAAARDNLDTNALLKAVSG